MVLMKLDSSAADGIAATFTFGTRWDSICDNCCGCAGSLVIDSGMPFAGSDTCWLTVLLVLLLPPPPLLFASGGAGLVLRPAGREQRAAFRPLGSGLERRESFGRVSSSGISEARSQSRGSVRFGSESVESDILRLRLGFGTREEDRGGNAGRG